MELLRIGPVGRERPVVRAGGRTYSLESIAGDIDRGFFAAGGIRRVREALAAGTLAPVDIDGERIGAPIARPGAVVCIGQNYAAHAAESGSEPPTEPILFFKHPNTVVGPFDDVRIPPGARAVDWEVELGVVIGAPARYLPTREAALACVAGYVVSNDVSERDYQLVRSGGQWSKGKSSETFNPLGPVLVPADEIDPRGLRIWSRIDGEPRQDSSTADMIFDVAELVRHLSQFLVLEPGDLVNTGTPQGVALSGRFPYLAGGEVMELGIDGLGVQQQRLVPADAVVNA
ncbi:fumarylacetoacetate hydrolase family protein [Microbacterium ureisolvens]|uniref:fumarylacetoacetate hydrolase family protein n=1 Tax=Microbacterium ureisolvens TaxID=2781186 RepID=UPI00362E66A8